MIGLIKNWWKRRLLAEHGRLVSELGDKAAAVTELYSQAVKSGLAEPPILQLWQQAYEVRASLSVLASRISLGTPLAPEESQMLMALYRSYDLILAEAERGRAAFRQKFGS